VIQSPRLDTALDVGRELLAENQILSANRADRTQEQPGQPHQVEEDLDERSHHLKHLRIMPDPNYARSRSTLQRPNVRDMNICGAQLSGAQHPASSASATNIGHHKNKRPPGRVLTTDPYFYINGNVDI
jgi:hypothetical protein